MYPINKELRKENNYLYKENIHLKKIINNLLIKNDNLKKENLQHQNIIKYIKYYLKKI